MPMADDSRRGSLCFRGVRLALVSCTVLVGGLVLSAAQASAASDEPPTIEGGQLKQVSEHDAANEHDATLEVWIDPHGNETSYTVWLECQSEHEPLLPCEPVANAQLVQGTIPAGLEGVQTIDIDLTGLTPGFDYWYAIRVVGAGKLVETRQNLFRIEKPYEAELPPWVKAMSEAESAKTVREYEARHAQELEAQHAKEAEQQQAREAAEGAEAAALKRRKEEQAMMTGGVSLAGTSVTVQRDGIALVKLECLGSETCHGKLTLTAPIASRGEVGASKGESQGNGRGKKASAGAITIGTVDYSIPGDEAKTVRVRLDAAGRALLGADRGRLSASLALLEVAPTPANTQTKTVSLVQRKTANARSGEPSLGGSHRRRP
jgi:hypothetical protein